VIGDLDASAKLVAAESPVGQWLAAIVVAA
jgi:hypothetical protein